MEISRIQRYNNVPALSNMQLKLFLYAEEIDNRNLLPLEEKKAKQIYS